MIWMVGIPCLRPETGGKFCPIKKRNDQPTGDLYLARSNVDHCACRLTMSKRLVVSDHAMKHVDLTKENSAYFVNIETMYQCIQACLNHPDSMVKCNQQMTAIKRFTYPIGLSNKQTIRIVFKQTKCVTFVITAYHI